MTAKNKGGRPSIFDRSMIDKAKEYVVFFMTASNEEMENHTEVIPSIAGLAVFLNVSRSTVYEWEKVNSEFSDILKQIMDIQETILINNGLKGKFIAPITKLMLTKHGYSDKQEIDNKSTDGSMTPKSTMTASQIKEIVQELKEEI